MRLLAYLMVMLLSHTAVGQIFDPPPLDPNPLLEGTLHAQGAPMVAPTDSGEAESTDTLVPQNIAFSKQ